MLRFVGLAGFEGPMELVAMPVVEHRTLLLWIRDRLELCEDAVVDVVGDGFSLFGIEVAMRQAQIDGHVRRLAV
jgi:hypothetical protein